MNKVFIKTLGCRLNVYDSDTLAFQLKNKGFRIVEDGSSADFCIINTCTVTHVADKKSRNAIKALKKQNPDMQTIVMGCGVKTSDNIFHELDYVDFIAENIDDVFGILSPYASEEDILFQKNLTYSSRTRAMVKVQNGCENFCAYCIIPYTRGVSESIEAKNIVSSIQDLEKDGFKEIVLTGINIAAYGCTKTTIPKESQFVDLLKSILANTSIPRIRLSSLGPEYFTDEWYEVLNNERICRHVHLSIQSGSDAVLQKMNRHYNVETLKEVIANLRKHIPDIAITTDVIVGFPGETQDQFQETYNFCEEVELSKIHVFPYSIRKGTVAASMNDQVNDEEKRERSSKLRALNEELNKKFIQKQIGKTVNILWESVSDDGNIHGLSDNYLSISVKKINEEVNSIQNVELREDNEIIKMGGI